MIRYALARIFSVFLFVFLSILGWKRSTVYANYRLAKKWSSSLNRSSNGEIFTGSFWRFYYKLLWNLCRHGGELLFCFSLFKELPRELEAYPCRRGGLKFEIDETNRRTPAKYGIRSIPSVLAFKDGELVEARTGLMDEETVTMWINELKAS